MYEICLINLCIISFNYTTVAMSLEGGGVGAQERHMTTCWMNVIPFIKLCSHQAKEEEGQVHRPHPQRYLQLNISKPNLNTAPVIHDPPQTNPLVTACYLYILYRSYSTVHSRDNRVIQYIGGHQVRDVIGGELQNEPSTNPDPEDWILE